MWPHRYCFGRILCIPPTSSTLASLVERILGVAPSSSSPPQASGPCSAGGISPFSVASASPLDRGLSRRFAHIVPYTPSEHPRQVSVGVGQRSSLAAGLRSLDWPESVEVLRMSAGGVLTLFQDSSEIAEFCLCRGHSGCGRGRAHPALLGFARLIVCLLAKKETSLCNYLSPAVGTGKHALNPGWWGRREAPSVGHPACQQGSPRCTG